MSETIKEILSEIICQELKDPRIGFVTITSVEMSPDLKNARVWVSVLGEEEEVEESLKALASAKGFIKAELGKRIRLRYMPEINFFYDSTSVVSGRINAILKEIEAKDVE